MKFDWNAPTRLPTEFPKRQGNIFQRRNQAAVSKGISDVHGPVVYLVFCDFRLS